LLHPIANDVLPLRTVDDFRTAPYETAIVFNVIDNDPAPTSGGSLTVQENSNPSNGTLTIANDGSVTYDPNDGFHGVDTFTYEVCDSTSPLNCASATVTILVEPPANIAPVASEFLSSAKCYCSELRFWIHPRNVEDDLVPWSSFHFNIFLLLAPIFTH